MLKQTNNSYDRDKLSIFVWLRISRVCDKDIDQMASMGDLFSQKKKKRL